MAQTDTDRWFNERALAQHSELRLVCLPFAGGHAGLFAPWGRKFPDHISVVPVHLPGHIGRLDEPVISDLDMLIRPLALAVMRHVADRPFAIFGHSMGALIGFALSAELEKTGAQMPQHLFVSGHRASQLPDPKPKISHLPKNEFIEAVSALGGLDAETRRSTELLDLLLPALIGDFALCENYVHRDIAPLSCPVSAIFGREDTLTSNRSMTGWGVHTKDRFTCDMVEGDHFSMVRYPDGIIQIIQDQLSTNQHAPSRVLGA